MLETIFRPGFHMLDQWQVQKFAEVALRAQVAIYSELEPDAVAPRRPHPRRRPERPHPHSRRQPGPRRANRRPAGRPQ